MERTKFDAVCEIMERGESLTKSCIECGTKISTFLSHITNTDQPEKASLIERYARARDTLIRVRLDRAKDMLFEPPMMTPEGKVDTGYIALQKLRYEAEQWEASKLLPKEYGNKVDVEHSGKLSVEAVLSCEMRPE
jgi:hypothetical protein